MISKKWEDVLDGGFIACQALIYESQQKGGKVLDVAALEYCQILADTCIGVPTHPKVNVYDIRIPCEKPPLCYDFSQSDVFLNRADVQ